jgi:DNA-binding transcriptional MocR family regulator
VSSGSLSRTHWRPELGRRVGPAYLAIADALAADVAAGRLQAGARLPSQRALARMLGVNLTTVTRAMREAERRGLVAGLSGSGTFVAPRAERPGDWVRRASHGGTPEHVDLAVNVPPDAAGPELARALAAWAAKLGRNAHACASLLPYREPEGAIADRAAGCEWLAAHGVDAAPERVLVTSGAQHGLALALAAVARPGDAVLCEALTYPGLRAAAASRGIRLVPVDVDDRGLVPASLRRALRRHAPRAIVCCPTLQNPTASVLPLERRRELAALARRSGLWIVEDGVYGPLAPGAPPPLCALAPERTIHLTSLSKTVSPGLRVGYVAAPAGGVLDALRAGLRASTWMTAPLTAALASAWIRDGTAHRATEAIRAESARRRAVAGRVLGVMLDGGAAPDAARPPAPHLWLACPGIDAESTAVARLARAGVMVTAGEACRVGAAGHGIRLCLGGAVSAAHLERALGIVREVMERRDQELEHPGP